MHPSTTVRTLAAGLTAALALVAAPAPTHALDPPVAFWDEATAGLSVNGTYTPVVGRFSNTGTYVESILWVSLTGGSSPLWTMNGSVTSRNVTLPAGGTPLVIYGIN